MRQKAKKTTVVRSDRTARHVKHFLAGMEKEDLFCMMSEAHICFLKMSQNERDAYAARGVESTSNNWCP